MNEDISENRKIFFKKNIFHVKKFSLRITFAIKYISSSTEKVF